MKREYTVFLKSGTCAYVYATDYHIDVNRMLILFYEQDNEVAFFDFDQVDGIIVKPGIPAIKEDEEEPEKTEEPGAADTNVLGRNIKVLRTARGWNQRELAKQVGVSSVAVSHWETGKKYPRKSIMDRLADVLEVPVQRLFRDE